GPNLLPALGSATLPASPAGASALWDERMSTVRRANSLEPLADATVERWFTDAFKPRKPDRWKQIRDTVAATTPAGYLGCSAAIMNYDYLPHLPSPPPPPPRPRVAGGGARGRPRPRATEAPPHRRLRPRRGLRGGRQRPPFPQRRAPEHLQPHHDGLARRTAPPALTSLH